jgi:hypothetical protein
MSWTEHERDAYLVYRRQRMYCTPARAMMIAAGSPLGLIRAVAHCFVRADKLAAAFGDIGYRWPGIAALRGRGLPDEVTEGDAP